ncbi:hypothetical protein JTE90_021676 [Oedothorax gibbosus]|uniref:Uncharacterized protein n=1 Tax=Oedothorax gibbosus TaxID=931172 RepID=A0AAV6TFM3_9ARAC|nr:hypothetical protein JTE90_021676 [Oedothorax gibbosus]
MFPFKQERKLEDRRRSDTALVLTINDASQRSGCGPQMTRRAASGKQKAFGFGGSMVQKLNNLKELTEGHHRMGLAFQLWTQRSKTIPARTRED